jgi:hypothetical protein
MIITSQQFLQESQSFEVIIAGNGFTRTIDMKLTLHPTPRSAYDVEIVNTSAINLTLKPGHTWLPSFLTLKDDTSARKIPIQIHEIDTGAGNVPFEDPITLAYIVKDDDPTDGSIDNVKKRSSQPTPAAPSTDTGVYAFPISFDSSSSHGDHDHDWWKSHRIVFSVVLVLVLLGMGVL